MKLRVLAAALAVLGACKGKSNDAPPGPTEPKPAAPGPNASDASAPADWRADCEAALRSADKMTSVRRVTHVIDGCRPCGDWTPLLRWNTQPADGGPTLQAIELAMVACKAYCNGNAKDRFLGALDTARGKPGRTPWRALGEACKDEVGAAADTRYMSAPYFALDRIARAVAAEPALAALADKLVIPLPPVSITGVGYELPTAAVTRPEAGTVHLTVTLGELRYGALPSARIAGGKLSLAAATYPGTLVDAKGLAAALDTYAGKDPATSISVIAPSGLPAARLADAIAAAGPRRLVLAVAAAGAPTGWSLPGTIPIALVAAEDKAGIVLAVDDSADAAIVTLKDLPAARLAARPTIAIGDKATVAVVAKLLGALAFRDVSAATLKRKPNR
jgi:hypothetical protein